MSIKDTKTRMGLVIEKTLKEDLEKDAKVNNRSLNNLINTILQKYIDEKKQK